MRAARLHRIGGLFHIDEIPTPEIGEDEVLVHTRTCGVCRTDLHKIDGLGQLPALPHTLGHEAAGIVAETGRNVTHLEVGEPVIPHDFFSCEQCYYCRAGREPLCVQPKVFGTTVNGGFAEYFTAPAKNLFVLPEQTPFEQGGLISCAVITALHAFRRSKLRLNDAAVVLGAGNVGQNLIQILKVASVQVIAIDRSEGKLEIASQLGADLVLKSDTVDAIQQIRALAGSDGVQCAFDVVGMSSTLTAAADYVMRGGRIVVIGEEPEFPKIDSTQIAQRELEIIGSRNGSRQDIIDAISMVGAGIITPLIVHRFPLAEINEALALMRRGEAQGKIVINVSA